MSRKGDKLQELVVTGREAAQQETSDEQASISGLYEQESASQLPCILNGAMAGFSGGALGYVFGFGGKLIRHRGKGRFKACKMEGWNSAKSFAIFGGVYAFASCIAQRLRQKQDAINGGIAGCATGLALGWSGGPAAALQNAVMLGLFSYVVDYMQLQSAEAASRHSAHMPARKVARRNHFTLPLTRTSSHLCLHTLCLRRQLPRQSTALSQQFPKITISNTMNATMRMSVALAVLLCAATIISAQPGNGGPFGGGRNNGGGGGGSSNGGSSNGGSSNGNQQQCNTGCCNLGNTVFTGACENFANYFKGDANTAINESDEAFQQRVNGAPTPSDRCCVDARSFTQYGCSCNQSLRDAAAPKGFTPNAISVIGRAVRFSICSNSAHGGSISSGGC
ncbi:g3943 [Coccomyxa elongata]